MNRNDDLSENPNYNVRDFPLQVSHEYMPELPTYQELVRIYPDLIHWHPDFEFVVVTDGTLDFCVNKKTLRIKHGHGIFVNSNRLHFCYSEETNGAKFDLVIVSTQMIETPFNRKELSSLCNSGDYLLFDNGSEIREILQTVIDTGSGQADILKLQSCLCQLAQELCSVCQPNGHGETESVRIMRKMLSFIKKHYHEKITVSDISKAGAVGRSKCFSLFREYMNITPQQYLTQFRLSKSVDFLADNKSVSETSKLCGFSTQSHFTKVFHDIYGVTPKDCKKQRFKGEV